jgi:PAS domain S-box-containing protein
VVQSSPLAIAELDLDGSLQWWNRAAASLFGWPEPGTGESEGRVVPVHPGAGHELHRMVARARTGEATVGSELRAFGHDDKVLELSVSTAPLRDHAGVVRGILAVMEDVTERLAMLEQFHQAERVGAMARLAGAVAHDFNNLLTVILGSSEMLLRQVSEPSATEEIAAIQRAGQRAAALTGQLLAIGQRNPVKPVVTDPDTAVENMLPMLARVMRSGVDVEHVNAPVPQRILVDPTELERAILNLAINANDAMPEGGRLSIVTTHAAARGADSAGEVVVTVSDDGVGMSEEIAAHCFEPFFTTKERGRGTGLGLAAVHAMVTQAGGRITVASAPGQGTTFTLTFPAAEGEPEAEAVEAEARHSAGGETVLLVEDEDELRRLAVHALEWRGYEVLEASSGAEALALARGLRRRPHLLLTDVVMPGMSGTELAAQLAERWPAMPILYVSGHLDEEATGPLEEGADLLPKPFTPDLLAKRVRLAIDKAQRSVRAQGSKR